MCEVSSSVQVCHYKEFFTNLYSTHLCIYIYIYEYSFMYYMSKKGVKNVRGGRASRLVLLHVRAMWMLVPRENGTSTTWTPRPLCQSHAVSLPGVVILRASNAVFTPHHCMPTWMSLLACDRPGQETHTSYFIFSHERKLRLMGKISTTLLDRKVVKE